MMFCPNCSNLLYIQDSTGSMQFFCRTCPYVQEVTTTVSGEVLTTPGDSGRQPRAPCPLQVAKCAPLATKEVDDVLGGKDAWKNVDQTTGACAWRFVGAQFACTTMLALGRSNMPSLLQQEGILHANSDSLSRRAYDSVLQGACVKLGRWLDTAFAHGAASQAQCTACGNRWND